MTEQDYGRTTSQEKRTQGKATGDELAEELGWQLTTGGSLAPTPQWGGEGDVTYSTDIGQRVDALEKGLKNTNKILAKLVDLLSAKEMLDVDAGSESLYTMYASEEVLAKEWLTPEEDEAWADL